MTAGHPAAEPIGWEGAARRLRRLQTLQVGVLVVFGVLLFAGTLFGARQLGSVAENRTRADVALIDVVTAREELRAAERVYFNGRIKKTRGLTVDILFRVDTARVRLIDLVAGQSWAPPAVTQAGRQTLAGINEVVDFLQRNVNTRPRTSAERRALDEFEAIQARLTSVADVWVEELDGVRAREAQRTEDARRRLILGAIGFVSALLAATGLLWFVLDRARGRVVAALRWASAEQALHGTAAASAVAGAPITDVLQRAAADLVRLCAGAGACVARLDPDGQVVIDAASGQVDGPVDAAIAAAIAERKMTRIGFSSTGANRRGDPPPARKVIAAPVTIDGAAWGAVAAMGKSGEWADEAGPLLERVAKTLSLAVSGLEARDRLAAQATTDALTSLANPRAFQERFATELAAARRSGRELSLAVLDIDHFKQVNDELGHQAGDEVLVEVARRIFCAARTHDLVARIGGEEFAWLMPDTEAMSAYAAVERVRIAVQATAVAQVPRLTISGGVCSTADTEEADELMRMADGALYWAKQNGRDLTCRYSGQTVDREPNHVRERLAVAASLSAVQALARAIDARDAFSVGHCDRVADLARRLALAAGWEARHATELRDAAVVHDVGMIQVPDDIIRRPGALDGEQRRAVHAHPELGARIASGVLSDEQAGWVRHHHERFDGAGYPAGLGGEDIPPGARFLAVAEAWDALTHDRPYRAALDEAEAYDECRNLSGSQFCPVAIGALERLWGDGVLTGVDISPT